MALRGIAERFVKPQPKTENLSANILGLTPLDFSVNGTDKSVAAFLEEAGFEVDTAGNGKIAVEKVEASSAGRYDLILMDVQMPEMDGYEATRRIRALPDKKKAAIPIVAMTANAFEEDQKNALNVGMNGHIAKPLDIQKLFQVLSELLK